MDSSTVASRCDIIPVMRAASRLEKPIQHPDGADRCFCHRFCWEQKYRAEAEQKHVPNRPAAERIGSSSGAFAIMKQRTKYEKITF